MKRLVALCTVVVQAATLLGFMRGNGRANVVLASRDLKAGTIVRSADVNRVYRWAITTRFLCATPARRILIHLLSEMLLRRQGLVGARWHCAKDPAERISGTASMGSPGELILPVFL